MILDLFINVYDTVVNYLLTYLWCAKTYITRKLFQVSVHVQTLKTIIYTCNIKWIKHSNIFLIKTRMYAGISRLRSWWMIWKLYNFNKLY